MRTIILSLLFTVLFLTTISAQSKDLNELGVKGYELALDIQFNEANKIFDELIHMEPENALGYLLKSLSYRKMWKYSGLDKDTGDKFKDLLHKTIDIAEDMLDKNEDDINALFYLGGAYGNLSIYYGNIDSWLKAFWYGRKGKNYFKKVIEKDPDYYDAYFGIGVYHYFAGVLPKYINALSFLLGIEGDRKKGIDEVILVSSKGNFTRDDAKLFLADDIYLQYENNFKAALPLLKELITKYPHNHYLKILLAECYRNLKNHDLSVQIIENALQSESLYEYRYLQSWLYVSLGRAYFEMNEFDQAISAFKNAHKISQLKKENKSWVYSWSLFNIGESYEMMGSIDKANEYFSQIKRKDNKNAYKTAQEKIENPLTSVQIKFTKGKQYFEWKKYTQGDVIFNDLLKSELNKKPLNNTFIAELYYYLARREYEFKELHNSIQTFRKVLALNDIMKDWIKPWSHYFLANCYRKIGETEKAKQEYDIAYEYDNNFIRATIDRARSEMK